MGRSISYVYTFLYSCCFSKNYLSEHDSECLVDRKQGKTSISRTPQPLNSAPAWGISEWYGHCRRQCIEARRVDVSARSVEKSFHLHFSVVWMGSHRIFVLCTALSLISAFPCHPWLITEQKKSIPKAKARYGTTNLNRRKFWDNETWAVGHFEPQACTSKFINRVPPHCATPPPPLTVCTKPDTGQIDIAHTTNTNTGQTDGHAARSQACSLPLWTCKLPVHQQVNVLPLVWV